MGKFISGCEKYPKELLEGRQTIEGSVIACIAKDLLLLDECGLTVNDFITQDGTYYFALLKHIRAQGIAVLDELSVLSNITDTSYLIGDGTGRGSAGASRPWWSAGWKTAGPAAPPTPCCRSW